jgi:hypothetical protein
MPRPPQALLAAALTLPLLLPAALRADDWPQWRGPNRDGVCGETGLLESFPAGGLKVCWRAPAGWGFSSPVVAQGRVYLADSEVVKPRALAPMKWPQGDARAGPGSPLRLRLSCEERTSGRDLPG